jgi:hypothetical protein
VNTTKIADELHKRLDSVERLLKRRDDDVAEMAKAIGDLTEAFSRQRNSIEALEAQLARVQASGYHVTDKAPIEAKPKRDGEPGRVVEPERGATISYAPRVPTNQPTLAQKETLLDIVRAKHPSLASVTIEDFSSCCDFVMQCGRKDQLNTEHYAHFWLDECSRTTGNWNVTVYGFIAACVALDVLHSDFSRAPYDLGFGLVRYGSTSVGDGWRRLL